MPMWWMHGYGDWGIAMMILMMLFWLLILAGIIFFVWFLVESVRRAAAAHGAPAPEAPLHVLQKRYARGEITREQYQEMKRELEG
jgi:putative membrane protein